jgi:hypothetical protein
MLVNRAASLGGSSTFPLGSLLEGCPGLQEGVQQCTFSQTKALAGPRIEGLLGCDRHAVVVV